MSDLDRRQVMLFAVGAGAATALGMRTEPAHAAGGKVADGYTALSLAITDPEFQKALVADPIKATADRQLNPTPPQLAKMGEVSLDTLQEVRRQLEAANVWSAVTSW
jgi:hypothetical protein